MYKTFLSFRISLRILTEMAVWSHWQNGCASPISEYIAGLQLLFSHSQEVPLPAAPVGVPPHVEVVAGEGDRAVAARGLRAQSLVILAQATANFFFSTVCGKSKKRDRTFSKNHVRSHDYLQVASGATAVVFRSEAFVTDDDDPVAAAAAAAAKSNDPLAAVAADDHLRVLGGGGENQGHSQQGEEGATTGRHGKVARLPLYVSTSSTVYWQFESPSLSRPTCVCTWHIMIRRKMLCALHHSGNDKKKQLLVAKYITILPDTTHSTIVLE